MEWLNELWRRIRMLFNARKLRSDLEEEMRLHVDLRASQQAERGLAPDQARTAALLRFGNTTVLRERSQDAWGWTWLESLGRDIAYGVRGLLRSPGVTSVALLSLALGIGANTAIFTLIDAVMLRSLPVKDPDRLVMLGNGRASGITDGFGQTTLYSYPVYRQIQSRTQVFSDVAAVMSMWNDVHGYVGDRAELEPMQAQLVSGTYFQMLGVPALLGRTITERDDSSEGDHPVAVISYSFWTRSLARDPEVLSKSLRMGSESFSIVGVAPPEFFGTKVGDSPDMWIPLSMMQAVPPHWGGYKDPVTEQLYIMGRIKPGVSLADATTNVNLVYQQIFHELMGRFPEVPGTISHRDRLAKTHVLLTPIARGLSDLRREFSQPLQLLMAVVALVLLIACANIANLLLARSTARARELALRQALGAARMRVARQLLTESLILALAGGALGVAFAAVATRLLLRLVSGGEQTLPLNVSMNTGLMLFTLAVTLLTALLFGTVPAFRATRLQLTDSLKDGRGTSSSAARSPLARALIVSQVALSLVLLVCAGLFLHSLVNLNRVDTGFDINNVLLLKTDESSAGYKPDDPRLPILHAQTEERVRALPGVSAASYSSFTFNEGSWNSAVFVQNFDNDKKTDVKHNVVGAGYFATMGIRLIAGRGFGPQDTATSPKVAIISEHMAHTMFPAGSPVGRHYGDGSPDHAGEIEVIGVARDVKFDNLAEPTDTLDYYPSTQYPGYMGDFEVRYSGDVGIISSAVQKTIHGIDRNLPITHVTTLTAQIANSIRDQSLVAELSAFFGLVAVFLSSIGIYGLMSYVVSRRTGEIGIRMALGAERSHVSWLVIREILLLIATGIAIGIPVTLAGGRIVRNMLFGLEPADPFSMIAATVLLFLVAILAGALPVRRATRVEPAIALRCE